VILVGGMASAVRSGIMAGLLMLAELFDRVGENERLLAIAGFFILLQNPLALKYDLGFQLSFLAMMGLFWFAPLIKNWLLKKSNGKWQEFIEVLSATIAAQIFTFPILIFNFGYVSIVSLLSNLLITPLMPFLMAFGLIFPIIGLIFSKLGWLLSFFDGVLTKGLLLIVDWSASVPFAILSFQINAWLVGLMYLIIFIFVFWLRKHFHNFEFLL
jgi:competence protein ComEC